MLMTSIETQRGQRIARIVLAIGLTLLGMYILQGFIRALLWAGVLAIATAPLYQRTQARFPPGRHNILLPLVFTVGTTLLFLVPLALIGIQLGEEGRQVANWAMEAREHGVPAPDWLDRLPVFHDQAAAWWKSNLSDPAGARGLLGRMDQAELLHLGREAGRQLLRRAILFGFTVLTLFFLFREGARLVRQLKVASARLFGPQGEPVAWQIVASVHGTVDGLVLVGLGEGAVLGIGYALAGAPHPALLGGATAIAAVIPMGAPIVLALAAALVLATGSTIAAAILFGVGMAAIFIADHAIRPVLIGGTTRLPFIWVLLGILGGVETFGLLGLFLGPAVMAALILLWREWTGTTKSPALESETHGR